MKPKFPFVSIMQLLCAAWIVVNVAAQILVAMLGLVYSLDNASQNIVSLGPTTIVDLSVIRDVDGAISDDTFGQQASAHSYGLQGEEIPVLSTANPMKASENGFQTIFTDLGYKSMIYRFTDYNPTDPTTYHTSDRTVNVTATCKYWEVYNVTDAVYEYDNGTTELPGSMFNYYDDNGNFLGLYVREWAYGATTYIADNDMYCGERCTRIYVLQAQQDTNMNQQPDIPANSIFDCNNTVSEVHGATKEGQKYTLPNGDPARAIAGAAGWTGYITPLANGIYEHLEFQLFSNDSYWSPTFTLQQGSGPRSAERYVSQYSIAALAAMDRQGPSATIADGMRPQQALKVTVEWANALILLAIIIVLQLVFLLLVVFQANKAVIKDDSFLAITKLLAPTVMTLGEHGSVLRGDEVAHAIDYQKGGNYKVFYGAREVRDRDEEESAAGGSGSSHMGVHRSSLGAGSMRSTVYGDTVLRAEVIERGMGVYPKLKGPFVSGKYD